MILIIYYIIIIIKIIDMFFLGTQYANAMTCPNNMTESYRDIKIRPDGLITFQIIVLELLLVFFIYEAYKKYYGRYDN